MASKRIPWITAVGVALCLLPGCPEPNPNPNPNPNPQTRSAYFQIPDGFETDRGPDAVLSVAINGDVFPDFVTANSSSNTLNYWLSGSTGTYTKQAALPVAGTEPRALAADDLDGDGLLDLVCANTGSDSLSVFYGTAVGQFAATDEVLLLPEGAVPRDVGVLDANGDGRMDLVSANSGLATLSLFLGLEEGGFSAPESLPAGDGPRSLLVIDLNNDQLPDVVTADRDSNRLSLFLNVAGALLAPAVGLPTGQAPRMVLGEDLDNDGWVDLVVTNPGSSSISVHRGTGGGAFVPAVFTPVTGNPTRMALGDFTGDGRTDIMTVLFASSADTVSSGVVQCLAGDGRARFTTGARYFLGAGIVALTAGDFDRDGTDDLAGCNIATNKLLVAEGLGSDGLAAERRYTAGDRPRTVVAGDINRDNRLDLVVGNLDSGNLTVLLGRGDGSFDAGTTVNAGGTPRAIALGRINGDNHLDLAVTNLAQSRVAILLGQGNGTFGAPTFVSVLSGTSTRSAEPRSIVLADLNRDSRADLAVGNANRDTVAVLLGDGAGGFAAAVEYNAGNFPLDVQVTEYNGDGHLDVVLVNGVDADAGGSQTSAMRTIPGKGDGTLDVENMTAYVANTGPGSAVVHDLDRDGNLDVATSHSALDYIQIFAGIGSGRFGNGGVVGTGDGPNAIGVADINRDGRPDLYTTNNDGTVTIRIHRFGLFYETAVSVPVGNQPIDGIVVDLDGDGRLDLVTPNRSTDDVSVILGR